MAGASPAHSPFVLELEAGFHLPAHDHRLLGCFGCCKYADGSAHSSDPYAMVKIVDKHGVSKGEPRRSLVKLTTLNPVWRFVFDFGLSEAEVRSVLAYCCRRHCVR